MKNLQRNFILFAYLFVGFGFIPTTNAIDVEVTDTLGVPPSEVWEKISDFCSIVDWHAGIENCELADQVGMPLRKLTTGDGAVIVEVEVFHSDITNTITYTIIDSPLPVIDYLSTITVTPREGGGSIMTWRGRFEAPEGKELEGEQLIRNFYEAGIGWLQRAFGA